MNLKNPPERVVIGAFGLLAVLVLAALRPELDGGLLLGAITAILAGLGIYESAYKRNPPR